MSSYVYVNVSFPCNKPEEVSEIAKQHHEILKTKEKFGEDMILRDACHFLKDICENKFATYSGNGSMISWAMIGDYTSPHDFVYALKDFFKEIYDKHCGPGAWDRVLFMFQYEQEHSITVAAIKPSESFQYRKYGKDWDIEIEFKEKNLPIFWNGVE